jgi:uncharacterized membrane protein
MPPRGSSAVLRRLVPFVEKRDHVIRPEAFLVTGAARLTSPERPTRTSSVSQGQDQRLVGDDLDQESIDAETLGSEGLGPERLTDEERILVLFAYLGPLAFISLLASRRDLVRWHARQGLLLGVLALATFVVLRPFHMLAFKYWPFLGQIFMTMEILVGLGFFLVGAFCLIRGLEGMRFRIPFLADLIDRF